MNNVAFDPNQGKPVEGDLVWSALPGAPVVPPRGRRSVFVTVAKLLTWVARRSSSVRHPTVARHASRAGA